jgi:hypothetical protein
MEIFMKPIEIRDKETNNYACLLLDPKGPEHIVGKEQLNRLKPYVLHLLETRPKYASLKDRFVVTKLTEENQAAFTITGEEKEASQQTFNQIREICRQKLTEQLIVPQYMGPSGPAIRHRVMEFEVQEDQMVVKYVTLGDFNNFDAAMKEVAALYPEVEQPS